MIATLGIVVVCTLSPLLLAWLYRQRINSQLAAVVVLGDIGRSPRCMYHALSLLENGYEVMLVGYKGVSGLWQFSLLMLYRLHSYRAACPQ